MGLLYSQLSISYHSRWTGPFNLMVLRKVTIGHKSFWQGSLSWALKVLQVFGFFSVCWTLIFNPPFRWLGAPKTRLPFRWEGWREGTPFGACQFWVFSNSFLLVLTTHHPVISSWSSISLQLQGWLYCMPSLKCCTPNIISRFGGQRYCIMQRQPTGGLGATNIMTSLHKWHAANWGEKRQHHGR